MYHLKNTPKNKSEETHLNNQFKKQDITIFISFHNFSVALQIIQHSKRKMKVVNKKDDKNKQIILR